MKRTSATLEENAVRAQLAAELHNKKQCAYDTYECTQLSIDGYTYCSKHILSDKNAPYKQCTYIYQSNGKKCYLPATKNDKKEFSYCSEHALKSNLVTNRKNAKCPPPPTAESILHSLSHYIKPLKDSHGGDSDIKVTKSIDPFVDLDASALSSAQCSEVLDLCSESESDIEPSTYSSVWHDVNFDSSDNESIDSEEEDPLKHANVYTSEEISLITRDKLVRLQSLYIEQYRYLQYLLKEKRRKYIHALKRERETCCNIYNQVHDNPKEQRLYGKLKQYKKYHRTYGTEALLAKKLRELRAKITEGITPKGSNFVKCCFTEGGVKCGERALPLAKHCRKHILEDSAQILFKTCGKMIGDMECTTPVEAIFDDSPCKLHMEIPLLRAYDKARKDSESDQDDTLDLPPSFAMPNTENVKTELMDYSSMQQEIPKMETLPTLLFEESADGLFSTDQDSQNLDATGSDTTDIDVTETSHNKNVAKSSFCSNFIQENNSEPGTSLQVAVAKNISSRRDSSFLADLCVLDDSKLEEMDKKWMNLSKVTSKESLAEKKHDETQEEQKNNEVENNEISKDVGAKLETEENQTETTEGSSTDFKIKNDDNTEQIENLSDHESYSKPAGSEKEITNTPEVIKSVPSKTEEIQEITNTLEVIESALNKTEEVIEN